MAQVQLVADNLYEWGPSKRVTSGCYDLWMLRPRTLHTCGVYRYGVNFVGH